MKILRRSLGQFANKRLILKTKFKKHSNLLRKSTMKNPAALSSD
jgi:hypothetical protein